MNTAEKLAFVSGVKVIDAGDYEGLPVRGTDAAKLAEVIGMTVGSDVFTANHLTAYKAMLKATEPKPAKAETANGKRKLPWHAIDPEKNPDDFADCLSDDNQALFLAWQDANRKAAAAGKAFKTASYGDLSAYLEGKYNRKIPASKQVICNSKFGRLNMTIIDKSEAATGSDDFASAFDDS